MAALPLLAVVLGQRLGLRDLPPGGQVGRLHLCHSLPELFVVLPEGRWGEGQQEASGGRYRSCWHQAIVLVSKDSDSQKNHIFHFLKPWPE